MRPLLFLIPAAALAADWDAPRVPAGEPPPAGLVGTSAADCGVCHQEIYKEWQVSTHAHAWTDVQFQGELHKDPEVDWLCINCHIPDGSQQEEIATFQGDYRNPLRQPNPDFDEKWQQEGISCSTCHIRDGQILGPYGDTTAPHPVAKDSALLTSELCLSCHQAAYRLDASLVCSFNTGMEAEAAGTEETCQSCHMPAVERPLLPGGPVREGRRHIFMGSRIPKDAPEEWELPYYDMVPSALELGLDLPTQARPGALVQGTVLLTNARAAHDLPTGDPERYLWMEAKVLDAEGTVLARTHYRVGQRWRWWPEAQQLADNRLKPGETREVPLQFVMPAGAASVEVLVTHYRISPQNAAYHKLEDYPISVVSGELKQQVAPEPQP